ncbi:hypothetical protein L917_03879 [Phytophthora nicotianae]|uniref:Uncharacterized protein n=1 Tax=Phytophthora nicotianae TaxID=4792 RepID=W2LRB7_PHYNI|nr:hypothetical protein L917_03879 [Phytophthora nicotianae]
MRLTPTNTQRLLYKYASDMLTSLPNCPIRARFMSLQILRYPSGSIRSNDLVAINAQKSAGGTSGLAVDHKIAARGERQPTPDQVLVSSCKVKGVTVTDEAIRLGVERFSVILKLESRPKRLK